MIGSPSSNLLDVLGFSFTPLSERLEDVVDGGEEEFSRLISVVGFLGFCSCSR